MKNCTEWSLEFDTLYQNITSNQAPGLDEYDKSVFLTRAQEAVVVMLYNGTLSKSFEETEEITAYLSSLVCQVVCPESEDENLPHIVPDSKIYTLPHDMLFRTYESCVVNLGEKCSEAEAIVVPVTQDEFWRTKRNPFKGLNKRRVLRLAFSKASTDNGLVEQPYSELVSAYPITSYTVRYIKRPDPIILTDLAGGLSINGKTDAMTCKLSEALHQTILTEAVKAAKAVWAS